jgi:hypothetical protein
MSVEGTGLTVNDINASFIPPSANYFHYPWAWTLTTYLVSNCSSPIHQPKTGDCKPSNTYHSATTTKQPPTGDSSHCTSTNATVEGLGVSTQDCKNYGYATTSASMDAWPGLGGTFKNGAYTKVFAHDTWLCVEVSWKLSDGTWVDNGSGIHNSSGQVVGERACAEVHS